ncbi:glycosyltransferase [Thermoproteus tenax Kra 1]|uniref:Glycosyltransferase n=1 Tax=Thermoproteus tenax (strain ATCC 35583 / DSM 2078 / JCM 9277 / NBRC 100435 / Kra 1) TaxID=768679 RepID=G4RK99_THETK|nr:glycosyltransferase [Thermoproteus tenax Kra 1]
MISVLHHSLPMINGKLAEEDGQGWHFRSAKALRTLGEYTVEAVRPSGGKYCLVKIIDDVPLILTPTARLSPSGRLWKWDEVSPALVKYVVHKALREEYVPYIHEYRALNSELIIRSLIDRPLILQHHGARPPTRRLGLSPIDMIKEVSKLKRESLLKKVKGVIFVVNIREKEYLEDILGVDAEVVFRTMAVDFDRLKPPSPEEKERIREELKMPKDAVVVASYMGVFGEEAGYIKGARLAPLIWRWLRDRYGDKAAMVVTGVSGRSLELYRRLGITAYPYLPHAEFIKIVKASDVYILPATPGYYGGPGVAVMEAMALGKPVVASTFLEMPRETMPSIGAVAAPYINTERDLAIFLRKLEYVIDNINDYDPWHIRSEAYKVFSWHSFVKDFNRALSKL